MQKFNGTVKNLAEREGITERQMYYLLKKPGSGFRRRQDGVIEIGEGEDTATVDVVNFTEWRAKKMKEDALKSQREREMLEGRLLSREEVISQFGAAFHSAKTSLLTIPTAIAGIVAVEDDANICKEIIEGAIRETLTELRGTITRIGVAGNSDEAASEVEHSSVG